MKVCLVDYGLGNVLSVTAAIEALGHTVVLDQTGAGIGTAPVNVVPGVAHFASGMRNLNERGQAAKLKSAFDAGDSVVGLCLGAQMLLDSSEEAPGVPGLSLLPGSAVKLDSDLFPLPNHGWRRLVSATDTCFGSSWLASQPFVFFSHSYQCIPLNASHVVCMASVGNDFVNAALAAQNAFAVQFHPEKSGEEGLRVFDDILKAAVGGR